MDLNTQTIVGEDGMILRTTDGGVSWDTVDLPAEVGNVYMLDFYDENLGMIVQDKNYIADYLFRTNDGGITWTKLPLATNTVHHDIEFLPGHPSNVWFTDYNNTYKGKVIMIKKIVLILFIFIFIFVSPNVFSYQGVFGLLTYSLQ